MKVKRSAGYCLLYATIQMTLIVLEMCIYSTNVGAQKQPSLPPAFKQTYTADVEDLSLSEITHAITERTKISILIDGEPLLQKASFALTGTLREALDRIADKFDYTWTLSKSGIVLMSKRFQDPKERPQVSLLETRQIVKDVVQALQTVTYAPDDASWAQLLTNLVHSLTPQQQQLLYSPTGLSGALLYPQQSILVLQASLGANFGTPLTQWTELANHLNQWQTSFLMTKVQTPDPLNPTGPQSYTVLYCTRNRSGRLDYTTFVTEAVTDTPEGQKNP